MTDTITVPGIWTSLEIHLSIICSCAPTFPKLFAYWYRQGQTRLSGYSSEAKKSSGFISSSGARSEDSAATLTEHDDPKLYTVHVQTDIEIQRIKRSSFDESKDLAKEYRWISG